MIRNLMILVIRDNLKLLENLMMTNEDHLYLSISKIIRNHMSRKLRYIMCEWLGTLEFGRQSYDLSINNQMKANDLNTLIQR